MNNFIIEHTTDIKILLLVPLDHRNIFQAHWSNLKAADLTFKKASKYCKAYACSPHFVFVLFFIKMFVSRFIQKSVANF
jgi:uncharacterized protein YqhQ